MSLSTEPHVIDVPLFQVDVAALSPFEGNPAAVCLLQGDAVGLSDALRQKVAAEMNLSETAFVEPLDGQASTPHFFASSTAFRLRWFTPTVEVPLCGHATLAAAAAVFLGCQNPHTTLTFQTLSGELAVRRVPGAPHTLSLDLPLADITHDPPKQAASDGPLIKSLGEHVRVKDVAFTRSDGLLYLLVHMEGGRSELEQLSPDFTAMEAAVTGDELRGVIVTCHDAGSGYDVLSRFFAPWLGVNEDPVTGSAHCVLGPYWKKLLGRDGLSCRQCSKRGGNLLMRVDPLQSRVHLEAPVVMVVTGALHLPRSLMTA